MLNMLAATVDHGTAKRAKVKGYHVAGKTGTARVAGKHGYMEDRHVASFAGLAPVSQPRVVIVVVITEPQQGSYYGGTLAAPVFAEIMRGTLRILGVSPDNIT